MTESTFERKLNDARQVRAAAWRDDAIFFGSAIVAVLFLIGIPVFENDGPLSQFGYITNAFTELLSIGLTVLVLNRLAERREQSRQRGEHLQRVIREMRSPNADEGARAVDEARERGFLTDGSLSGVNLSGANLSKFGLFRANLSKTNFYGTNLSEARLWESNLSGTQMDLANLNGALLFNSDLSEAVLFGANLRKSQLFNANLSKALLYGADLKGANLCLANLSGAKLKGAHFDETTVLPDSVKLRNDIRPNPTDNKYWTPDTDMSRYTNPDHPDFWQPPWARMGFETWSDWDNAGSPEPDDTPDNP